MPHWVCLLWIFFDSEILIFYVISNDKPDNNVKKDIFLILNSVIVQDKKKKYEPPIPTRVGKKQKKAKGPDAANKLPQGEERRTIYCLLTRS